MWGGLIGGPQPLNFPVPRQMPSWFAKYVKYIRAKLVWKNNDSAVHWKNYHTDHATSVLTRNDNPVDRRQWLKSQSNWERTRHTNPEGAHLEDLAFMLPRFSR